MSKQYFRKICKSMGNARIYGVPYNPEPKSRGGIQLDCSNFFDLSKRPSKEKII